MVCLPLKTKFEHPVWLSLLLRDQAHNILVETLFYDFSMYIGGSITDVRILRGVDPSLDREAMRVVKSMPRWTPGKQNGSAVRVKYQVPVAFRLQ